MTWTIHAQNRAGIQKRETGNRNPESGLGNYNLEESSNKFPRTEREIFNGEKKELG